MLKVVVATIVMQGAIIFSPLMAAYADAVTHRPLDMGKALAEESLQQSICNISSLQTISCNKDFFTHPFFYENSYKKINVTAAGIDPYSISAQLPENALYQLLIENGLISGAEYDDLPEHVNPSKIEDFLEVTSATFLIFGAGLIGLVGLRRGQSAD